jgi:hypothetical protein
MEGTDARDMNRRLLSALRRIEKRTRLRAEWTAGGTTYRFFDYVSKSERNWSGADDSSVITLQLASMGPPAVSMTGALINGRPCLAAVDR